MANTAKKLTVETSISTKVPYKVLVVEDNELVLKVLDIRLKNKGAEAVTVSDPTKVEKILEDEKFDLVVLDYLMPEISGIDILKKIRTKFSPTELPVIMISDESQEDNLVDCLRYGANDYIKKPINFTIAWVRVETQITIKRFNDEIEKQRKDSIRTASMKMVLEMASTVSHEIINPLTVVDGRIEFLKAKVEEITFPENQLDIKEGIFSDIENIQNSILRTESVVEGLRAFAVDNSKEKIKDIDFHSLKERIHSVLNGLLLSAGVELELPDSDIIFKGKESIILQAIFNLVMNSRKEISKLDNPKVKISAEKKNDKMGIIRVQDNGKGIDAAVQSKMFKPFFSTDTETKSSGMGLSISKENLEEIGGTLYYNKDAPNTEFVIEVPLSGTDDNEK